MTRLSSSLHDEWVNAAAQLICTLHLTDYQLAKLKARDQLGLGADAALPDNLSVDLTDSGQVFNALSSLSGFDELDRPEVPKFDAVVHFAALARIRETPMAAMAS